MIRLDLEGSPTAAERWAFELLVDLSRLLPLDPSAVGGLPATVVDSASGQPDLVVAENRLRVGRSLLRQVVEIAGAAAEQRSTERDHHGRVPATANPLVQTGSERELPIQKAAQSLVDAVKQANGAHPLYRLPAWPDQKGWAAAFTHDLDIVSGWPLFAGLRWVELLRKGELGRAGASIGSALGSIASDPVADAIRAILELERSAGIRATWFVIAGQPRFTSWRRGDITYRLDSRAGRRIIEQLQTAGHEIGLHASFETRDSVELMTAEREMVARVSGKAPQGVRQHFLRFDPAITPAGAGQAGFSYDASFGFADRNGFRLGLADVIPLWQDASSRALPLLEAPLTWMDRTHSKYQGEENPNRWVDDALELAESCREAGGLWTGLWHPNVVPALGFPGALGALARLIQQITTGGPYIAPLADLVAWRAARRGLRGRINSQGGVELVSQVAGSWSLGLENLSAGELSVYRWPDPAHG